MISCSIETGGGEGLVTRLGLPSPVYDLLQYRNWRRGRPGNKARPSPSPVYDLLQYKNWRRGRPGNKARPSPSPVYDLLQYKNWRREGLGTRLGLLRLQFMISCSIKTGGGKAW